MHRISMLLALSAQDKKFILIASLIVLVVISFVVGFSRGFTRTGWGAFIWGCACVGWYFLVEKVDGSKIFKTLGKEEAEFFFALISAVGVILVSFILFGSLSAIVRPKKKHSVVSYNVYKHNGQNPPKQAVSLPRLDCVYNYEYEDEEAHKREKRQKIENYNNEKALKKNIKKAKGTPSAFNRILGGLISSVNFTLVLAGIGCLVAVILPAFVKWDVEGLVSSVGLKKAYPTIMAYGLDFALIAMMMGMAYGGYKAGFFRGLFGFIMTYSTIGALIFAIAFPFIGGTFAHNVIGYFAGLSAKIMPDRVVNLVPKINMLCGTIITCICSFVVALVGLWIILSLLKLALKGACHSKAFRVVDGCFGVIVMLIFATLLIILVVSGLKMAEHFSVDFHLERFYSKGSKLLKGFFTFFHERIRPFFKQFQ